MKTPFLYSLKMAWQHKKALQAIVNNADAQVSSVQALDLAGLKQAGIEALVLDFDGVLVAHGETAVSEVLKSWLKQALAIFGPNRVFILSNLQRPERAKYFAENLPDIIWISAKCHKPHPAGLEQIMKISQLTADKLLVIDDRLLTGILASLIVGAQSKWVLAPLINLNKRPVTESFFIILRKIERILFQ